MTGTKILWGQMLGALLAVLTGLWGATEWTAWRLGFQPALGLPWFRGKRSFWTHRADLDDHHAD